MVAAEAREYFGNKVFDTVIPRNVRLAEAPSFGKPIILYDVASVGAQAYMGVARELLDRAPVRRNTAVQPVELDASRAEVVGGQSEQTT